MEDDSDDERLALRAVKFANLPVEVRVVHDGLELLQDLGLQTTENVLTMELPDLILCDLKLPIIKGDEVLEKVRKEPKLAELPFVMFSSSDEPRDRDRCLSLGATAYWVKPIEYRDYLSCVDDLLHTHLKGFATQTCLAATA